MENQKTLNFLNETSDSKFTTRKWNMVNDQSNANYDIRNESFIQTKMSILKDSKLEYIIYQKELLIIITSSLMEKTL